MLIVPIGGGVCVCVCVEVVVVVVVGGSQILYLKWALKMRAPRRVHEDMYICVYYTYMYNI